MIITQIAFSLIYGITYTINTATLNISAVVNVIALAILVIAGRHKLIKVLVLFFRI
jgi:hypothetical protein